jgi:hypothetical protein
MTARGLTLVPPVFAEVVHRARHVARLAVGVPKGLGTCKRRQRRHWMGSGRPGALDPRKGDAPSQRNSGARPPASHAFPRHVHVPVKAYPTLQRRCLVAECPLTLGLKRRSGIHGMGCSIQGRHKASRLGVAGVQAARWLA